MTITAVTYWTYDFGNGREDYEFNTKDDALNYANDVFYEGCHANGLSEASLEIDLIMFHYDEADEVIVDDTIKGWVEYVAERSDRDEHSSQGDYI